MSLGILSRFGRPGPYLPLPPGEGRGEGTYDVDCRSSAKAFVIQSLVIDSSFGHSSFVIPQHPLAHPRRRLPPPRRAATHTPPSPSPRARLIECRMMNAECRTKGKA